MRLALPAAFAIILAITNPASAAKIAIDPNKSAPKPPAQETPDTRLDQKVTYTATGKRLHTVLEDISKQTGVTIYSGKAPTDWQVRDIPVIVCVKDIPLAKLLRSLADATHLALTSTTVDEVKRYRIYRDYKRQKQLDDYFQSREEYNRTRTSAMWDAWTKLSRMSDEDIKKAAGKSRGITDPKDWQDSFPATKSFAKLMTLLPQGSKDTYMSGRRIRLNTGSASPALAQALRTFYNEVWDRMRSQLEAARAAGEPVSRKPLRELTEAAMAKMDLIIDDGTKNSYHPYMQAEMRITVDPGVPMTSFVSMAVPQGDLAMIVLNDRTNPSAAEQPSTDYAPFFVTLDPWSFNETNAARFKFAKPKEDPTYAQVMSTIAERTGYSIIAEDFISHTRWEAPDTYNKDLTFADLLRTDGLFWLQRCGSRIADMEWRIDPDTRLLVGSDQCWFLEHHTLAPERVIARLVDGVNGDGLELDDTIATLLLPQEQNFAWVDQHRDLSRLLGPIPDRYRPLWRLYASLSPKDKAKAKSKEGFALAGISKDLVTSAFAQSALAVSEEGTMGAMDALNNWVMSRPDLDDARDAWMLQKYPMLFGDHPEDALADIDFAEMVQSLTEAFPDSKLMLTPPPTDPAAIAKLRMYLLEVDLSAQKHWKSTFNALGLTQPPHTYTLLFEGDGIKLDTGAVRESYPIFSETRQRQLKEAQQNSAKNAPAHPTTKDNTTTGGNQ